MKVEVKRCYKCGQFLPITQFYIDRSRKDGLRNMCKRCEHLRYVKNKKRTLQRDFTRYHGLGLLYKKFILASQGFECAICGKVLDPSGACLDHSHRTGKIRGVLCSQCNLYIGKYGDNIFDVAKGIMRNSENNALKNAYDYLLKAL